MAVHHSHRNSRTTPSARPLARAPQTSTRPLPTEKSRKNPLHVGSKGHRHPPACSKERHRSRRRGTDSNRGSWNTPLLIVKVKMTGPLTPTAKPPPAGVGSRLLTSQAG